jgi:hypothetical protein
MILKAPKRENFELVFFFTLSDTIWLADLGTEPKMGFFYIIFGLISMDFGFLPQAECSVKIRFVRSKERKKKRKQACYIKNEESRLVTLKMKKAGLLHYK